MKSTIRDSRRSLDLFLVYTQSFQETVTTIEKEEITANVLSK